MSSAQPQAEAVSMKFWLAFVLFIYLEQTQNKKQNRILLSDWAQDPHQDGTPRTLQLLSEPKVSQAFLFSKSSLILNTC